jgi:hypothetical protein
MGQDRPLTRDDGADGAGEGESIGSMLEGQNGQSANGVLANKEKQVGSFAHPRGWIRNRFFSCLWRQVATQRYH